MFGIFEKRWDCICVPNEDVGDEEEHLFPLVALVPNVLVGEREYKKHNLCVIIIKRI
jgi:hypothetical protein